MNLSWAKWSTVSAEGIISFWQEEPKFKNGKWDHPYPSNIVRRGKVLTLSHMSVTPPEDSATTLRKANEPPRIEFTEEQWTNILGEYETSYELEGEEKTNTWLKLSGSRPFDASNSLHVIVNMYEVDDTLYECCWALSSDSEEPNGISVQVRRKQISPVQLEMFEIEAENDE
jgi:hypothetical protein